jgi:basic membrane protein A
MRRIALAPIAALVGSALIVGGGAVAQDAPEWKIAMIADVGSIDDRGFNQFTYEGAKAGAAALGLAEPAVVIPKDESEYAQLIEALVADGNNIIVTTGFNLATATTVAAKANPDVWFIGTDQDICVDANGDPDDTPPCDGDAATLLPKLVAMKYREDQAGYLAGMVAADLSENGSIAAIGGVTFCAPCVKYIQGYKLGAQAINPDIQVADEWVTDSDINAAFYDQPGGTLFTEALIEVTQPDVIFQVAGQTGLGAIDAACAAGLYAIGVDANQYETYPEGQPCIVTSAEKKLADTTSSTIQAVVAGTATGGTVVWDAASGGVAISPLTPPDAISPETQAKIDEAIQQMGAGTLVTCPENCGTLIDGELGIE